MFKKKKKATQLVLEHITMNIFHKDTGGIFAVQSQNCIPSGAPGLPAGLRLPEGPGTSKRGGEGDDLKEKEAGT